MNDRMVMSIFYGRTKLVPDITGFPERELSTGIQNLTEILSIHEFIHPVRITIIGTDIEDFDNIPAIQRSSGTCLPLKTSKIRFICCGIALPPLNGNIVVINEVMCFKDNRPASFS